MRHVYGSLVAAAILVLHCPLARAQENATPENPKPTESATSQPGLIEPGSPAPITASTPAGTATQPQQTMTYVRRGLFGRRVFAVPTTTNFNAPTTTNIAPGTTYYYPRTFRRPFWRLRAFFAPGPVYYSSTITAPTYTYSAAYQGPGTPPAGAVMRAGTFIPQPPAPVSAPAFGTSPAPPPPSGGGSVPPQ